MQELEGKIVIVTSGNLGNCIVSAFDLAGATLILPDCNKDGVAGHSPNLNVEKQVFPGGHRTANVCY